MTAEKLIFLDKSGVNINITRHYERGKGRVCDELSFPTPKNTTLLSSIRLDDSLTYNFFECTVNGKNFLDTETPIRHISMRASSTEDSLQR